jgi:hypothetical protein
MQRAAMLSFVASVALPHFRNYLINGRVFGKKLPIIKRVFRFLYNFYSKHFSSLEELGEMKLGFSSQTLEKRSNTKFHKKQSN